MRVLALDIATTTGWAVDRSGDGGPSPLTGTKRLAAGSADGARLGRAGLEFAKWLDGMIRLHAVETVAIEAPAMGGRGIVMSAVTARMLIGLAFTAEVVAASADVPVWEAAVSTARKNLLGTGRPADGKKAVVERCRLLGWQVKDHNAADAACLWALAKGRLDREWRLETATPLFRAGAA